MLDERHLEALDADDEARRDGRSALLRRAATEYLANRRREAIAERYRRAYATGTALDAELEGWADGGAHAMDR